MLIDAVFGVLQVAQEMLSAQEIYGRVALERPTSKGGVSSSLTNLKMRGKVIKEGRLWGAVTPTDSTEHQRQP